MRAGFTTLVGAILLCSNQIVIAGEPDLASRLKSIISAPEYQHGRWGILVINVADGRAVFEHNADQMFIPASTTKLYSCSSALHHLGPDYRFETPVYRRGVVEKGRLLGDLILVAAGDLTLGGRTLPDGSMAFANNDHTYAENTSTIDSLTSTDPLSGLIALAKQVRAAGIESVDGEVLIDARLFDSNVSSGSGPKQVTPILINDNVIDVIIAPGAEPGRPATVTLRPSLLAIMIDAQVETTSDGRPQVEVHCDGPNRIIVRGRIPVNSKPQLRICPVGEPVAFARGLFIEALRSQGVKVAASPLREPRSELPERGAVEKLTRVAVFKSPPLSEAIRVTLKVSHNLYASTLPLLVAAHRGERTLAAGLRLQKRFLTDLGIETNAIAFAGGAGGAPADSTTPRATVGLLRALMKQPQWPTLERALPTLGIDGTLATVVSPESPAYNRVHAKTGTLWYEDTLNGRALLRSKALAGVMTTARGAKLAFAIFVNDVPLPLGVTPAREGKVLGKLCEILYQFAE